MTAWFKALYGDGLHRLRRYAFVLLLLPGLIAAAQAAPNQVTLNLKNVDINALIESVSAITGKNFIVDPRVKAQVSVISSKPMNEDEVYEVFLAVLTVNGFAAVPSGPVIKILPAAGAKQETIPTVEPPIRKPSDQVVTEVIQVQNVSAAQIVPILRPLIPPQGHLAAYAPTNVLIISDTAGNVERIGDIIRRMDRASDEGVEIIPLQHASATEVVRTITTLEQAKAQAAGQAGGQAGTPARLVADERTNSILLSGDRASRLRLRALIAHLDTPVQREGNTQVIYLRYAKAKDLAQVLTGVSKKIAEEQQQTAPGQQGGAPPPLARGGGGGGGSGAAGNLIDIQADDATNSLVVTGPPAAIAALRSVIAQLDLRRAQVLVEAAIAEISTNRTAQLGIQWIATTNGVGIIGATNFTLGQSLANIAQAVLTARNAANGGNTTDGDTTGGATGTSSGLSGVNTLQGLNAGVGDNNGSQRFAIIVSALAGDSETNVLSTPTVVTMDNEEATLFVGQNVPIQTGSYSTTATTGINNNAFNTTERRDVGLKLKVKPQINEGNAVRLKIIQNVENVVANANSTNPTFQKREIETSVLVEDGQILVLGGLIGDQLDQSQQKVPLLGDIPYLGELFRYRSGSKTKKNLMVFLHPIILRDGLQGTLATSDKYNYIRDQELAAQLRGSDYLLSDVQPPTLPAPAEVKKRNTMLNTAPPPALPVPQPPPEPVKPAPPPSATANDDHFDR